MVPGVSDWRVHTREQQVCVLHPTVHTLHVSRVAFWDIHTYQKTVKRANTYPYAVAMGRWIICVMVGFGIGALWMSTRSSLWTTKQVKI